MKDLVEVGRRPDARAVAAGAAAGLAGGLVASWLMVVFQKCVWPPPNGDEGSSTGRLAQAIAAAIDDQPPLSPATARTAGTLIHYALGAGLGLAYGAAAEFRPGVTASGGVAMGVATEVAIDQALVPALGLANPFWRCPIEWHLRGLAAHVVFGAATELTRRAVLKLIGAAVPASGLPTNGATSG